MTAATAGGPRLVRDRLTLTLYTPFITWGWFLYGFSPAVPLIAAEQDISRGQAGLHGTAMAVGTIASGLVSSPIALRFGRKVQALLGGGILVVGIAMLLTGSALPATLLACFVTAVGGNLTISAAQPALAVHQGRAGAAAVTEANAAGAGIGLLAPLALGLSVGAGWGWRPAVAFVAVLAVVAALLLVPIASTGALGRGTVNRAVVAQADATQPAPPARQGFTRTFWLFWVALVCGVAVEFATTFWASDMLVQQTDAPASLAAASVSALVIGMAVSRVIVGPLSMRKAPEKLLLLGFGAAALGWLLFWVATSPLVAMAGLVLAGLGYGTHYPLGISLVMRASDGRPDLAQARSSLGTGAAVAVSPFLLGSMADVMGAHTAFLLVPALLLVGGLAVGLGYASHRAGLPTSQPADAR